MYNSSVHEILNFKFYLIANNHFKLFFYKKIILQFKCNVDTPFQKNLNATEVQVFNIKAKYLLKKDVSAMFLPWKPLLKKMENETKNIILIVLTKINL